MLLAVYEYFLDRERALAYFIPPPNADELVLSGAESIIEASALVNVVIQGLSMQFARGTAVACAPLGLGPACDGFVLRRCTVANVGEQAVGIAGFRSGVIAASTRRMRWASADHGCACTRRLRTLKCTARGASASRWRAGSRRA